MHVYISTIIFLLYPFYHLTIIYTPEPYKPWTKPYTLLDKTVQTMDKTVQTMDKTVHLIIKIFNKTCYFKIFVYIYIKQTT